MRLVRDECVLEMRGASHWRSAESERKVNEVSALCALWPEQMEEC